MVSCWLLVIELVVGCCWLLVVLVVLVMVVFLVVVVLLVDLVISSAYFMICGSNPMSNIRSASSRHT